MTVRVVMMVDLKYMVVINEDHDEGKWKVRYVDELRARGVSNVDDSPLQAL